jgi:hypothetical protein
MSAGAAPNRSLRLPLSRTDPEPTSPTVLPVGRPELEDVARSLPESDLKAVILATLADRLPTPREAFAWVFALQRRAQEGGHALRD